MEVKMVLIYSVLLFVGIFAAEFLVAKVEGKPYERPSGRFVIGYLLVEAMLFIKMFLQ